MCKCVLKKYWNHWIYHQNTIHSMWTASIWFEMNHSLWDWSMWHVWQHFLRAQLKWLALLVNYHRICFSGSNHMAMFHHHYFLCATIEWICFFEIERTLFTRVIELFQQNATAVQYFYFRWLNTVHIMLQNNSLLISIWKLYLYARSLNILALFWFSFYNISVHYYHIWIDIYVHIVMKKW